jgi:ABC-2 type transport system ATP-binding protein
MIQAKNVIKTYGETRAVQDVSFSMGKGEILGLLGPNGAGKTTLMKILTCYHFPDYGSVEIAGENIFLAPEKIKEIIGYLPENAPVYADLNVFEYLDFISDARHIQKQVKKKRLDRAVDICGLSGVLYKPIDQLSKGYRQRVGLAQAIIHDPDILILDEPTTGLDPNQIVEIRKLIQRLGREKTVILSTHILREVEVLCNRVLIMNRGEIAASGTADEISGQLEGGSIVFLRCKGRNYPAFAADLLEGGAVSKITGEGETKGYRELQCAVGSQEAGAEYIFDSAVKHNMKIVELRPVAKSLEDIFIELTGKEEQKHV